MKIMQIVSITVCAFIFATIATLIYGISNDYWNFRNIYNKTDTNYNVVGGLEGSKKNNVGTVKAGKKITANLRWKFGNEKPLYMHLIPQNPKYAELKISFQPQTSNISCGMDRYKKYYVEIQTKPAKQQKWNTPEKKNFCYRPGLGAYFNIIIKADGTADIAGASRDTSVEGNEYKKLSDF